MNSWAFVTHTCCHFAIHANPIRHDRFDAFCRINSHRRLRRAWMKSRQVAAMVNRGLTTSVILCADRFTADSFPTRVIASARIEAALKVGSYPVSIPRNDSATASWVLLTVPSTYIYMYIYIYVCVCVRVCTHKLTHLLCTFHITFNKIRLILFLH